MLDDGTKGVPSLQNFPDEGDKAGYKRDRVCGERSSQYVVRRAILPRLRLVVGGGYKRIPYLSLLFDWYRGARTILRLSRGCRKAR